MDSTHPNDKRKGLFGDVDAELVVGYAEQVVLPPDGMRARDERRHQWVQHVEALHEIDPGGNRRFLGLAYMSVKNPFWDMPDAPDAEFFEALVHDLTPRWAADGIPPLLVFIDLLVSGFVGGFGALRQAVRSLLGEWVARGIDIWGIEPTDFGKRRQVAEARAQEILAEDPALLIAIESIENRSGRFSVSAWVWLAEGLCERIGNDLTSDYAFEDIRQLLQNLRRDAFRYVSSERWKDLTVEIFLPRPLLSEPVHSWPILLGLDQDDEVQICEEHRVAVRCAQRSLSPKEGAREVRAKWWTKWNRLVGHAPVEGSPVYMPESVEVFADDKEFFRKLRSDEVLCYAETVAPPATIDHCEKVVRRIINAGLPLGLWLRPGCAPPAGLYGDLKKLAQPSHLRMMRESARDTWCVTSGSDGKPASLGSLLVLLYDDPTRLPFNPDRQLGFAR